MSHLNAETLARLVDDQPSALEAAHLAGCAACSGELDAMRADMQALGELGMIEPPAHAWDALHERLIDEGLVRSTHWRMPAYMRIAAALALFMAGTGAGFAWRGATMPAQVAVVTDQAGREGPPGRNEQTETGDTQGTDAVTDAADATTRLASTDAARSPAVTGDTPSPAAGTRDAPAAAREPRSADDARDTRMAAAVQDGPETQRGATRDADPAPRGEPRITGPLPSDPRFALQPYSARNAQEAATMLRDAEGWYLDALAQYAQLSSELSDIDDPVARLVALETIVLTTREALDRAPADPIINGYHMTALAQRDATLRQLAARARNPVF